MGCGRTQRDRSRLRSARLEYAKSHQGRVSAYGPLPRTREQLFWERTTVTDNCWLWVGSKNKAGYGKLKIEKHTVLAHRLAWTLFRGVIPDGIKVLHSCDNPSCVRPDHLFLGTNLDNSQDMVKKGRSLKGELHHNAFLTAADVIRIRSMYAENRARGRVKYLARKFSVSTHTIKDVVSRRTWSHL